MAQRDRISAREQRRAKKNARPYKKAKIWPLVLLVTLLGCAAFALGCTFIIRSTVSSYKQQCDLYSQKVNFYVMLLEQKCDYERNIDEQQTDSQLVLALAKADENIGAKTSHENIYYILDEEKNVVYSAGRPGERFDYDEISKAGLYTGNWDDIAAYWEAFTDDELTSAFEGATLDAGGVRGALAKLPSPTDAFNTIYGVSAIPGAADLMKMQSGKLGDLSRIITQFASLYGRNKLLWFEKTFTVGQSTYTLLAGKTAAFSPETLATLSDTVLTMVVVLGVLFILLIWFIISQGVSNRRLSRVAYTDPVTGGANRYRFRVYGDKQLKKLKRRGSDKKWALVLFDVDGFRILNDVYGTTYADNMLKRVNGILTNFVRTKELTARFAGDEFSALVYYNSREELDSRIYELNARLINSLDVPNLHFSFGIYELTASDDDIERAAICAGFAKDAVKRSREKFVGYFDDEMRNAILRERELEAAADEAFAQKQFKVYLQPKYTADGARIGGAEALVRWISPTLGFISPGEFVPLFEKNYMVIRLDLYMLDAVCALQRKWLDEGRELVTVSVNISRSHLSVKTIISDLAGIVDAYSLPHSAIEFELTESAFFDDKDVLLTAIQQLRALSFHVSMDDFGTGYSSLNSLKDLPLDIVKLDRGFFGDSNSRERSETVIKSTISLAKQLNMKIVTEGIETKEQVDFLSANGCDFIQGFYFAKPMPTDDFDKLLYGTNALQQHNITEVKK